MPIHSIYIMLINIITYIFMCVCVCDVQGKDQSVAEAHTSVPQGQISTRAAQEMEVVRALGKDLSSLQG